MNSTQQSARQWWQDGVVYQIYPRSFQDSNGDGVGDLRGILARLDYLPWLGIDAIWISPFYPSPMADFGYDVADYTGVDPLFGTLDDFDRLIAAAHERSLHALLDFVPNHSSNQHPWFLASRSRRTDPKRDWYIWRDAKNGTAEHPEGDPPTNWMSQFGGSAWEWDATTCQYYLHSFLKEQPDLNWRNPEVKQAIFDAMRFWLDRGADGFRMDVLWLLIKDDQFRDNPPNPEWQPGSNTYASVLPIYTSNRPETHVIVEEMRALLDSYSHTADGQARPRVLIGEIYLPLKDLVGYYGYDAVAQAGGDAESQAHVQDHVAAAELKGAQMPFNFHLISTPWNAAAIAAIIEEYEGLLPPGAWPNWVLGNHDQPRLATRLGSMQARVAAMLLLTLRGTPTLYYGDELGMPDGIIPKDRIQDPAEKNQPGIGMGRDPERTPMLWDDSPLAGFTTGEPWLPLTPARDGMSVAEQAAAPRSMLTLYKRLLALRREHTALHAGTVSNVAAEGGVLRYERIGAAGERLLILLNLTEAHRDLPCPAGRILITTILDGDGAEVKDTITLEGHEGVVLELASVEG
jgi:alpha-glucosidase